MTHRLGPFLLPPLLLLGLFAREAAGPRAAGPGAELGPFLDAETAWHARRVELALSAGRMPQADRFLSHPHATVVAEPPLFPAVLAWTAGWILGEEAGGGGGRPPDERRLERLLSQAGPALGVLLVLLGFTAARRGTSSGAPGPGGLAAGAVLALAPGAVAAGAAGTLSLALWAAMLLCAQAWLCREAWSAREPLDRLQAGMIAGLLTGFGLASTPLFAGPTVAAWGGFLLFCYAAEAEEARDRARTGLLFSVSAILPAQLPTMDGPWQPAPPGPVGEWVQLSTGFLIAGCFCFAPAFLRPLRRARSTAAALALVSAAGVAAVLLVALSDAPSGPARPLRAALGLVLLPGAQGAERVASGPGASLLELGPWLALAALALAGGARRSGPEALYLGLAILLGGAAAAVHAPAALLALVPAALAVDARLCGAWGPLPPRARRTAPVLVGLAVLWSAGTTAARLAGLGSAGAREREAEGRELVRALRWLRENSEASGAWNAAGAGQDWGVLTEGALAPLVPYHARRPVLGTSARAAGDPPGQAESRAVLGAGSGAALVGGAAALGARYLVLRSGGARAERTGGELGPAARELAGGGTPELAGLRRVYPPAGDEALAGGVTIFDIERAR